MSKLYSDLKIFHFDSRLKDISTGTLSAPIHIRLKPTNRCNHRCYYCCYRNDNLYLSQLVNENDEIDRAKMKEIVTDLTQMGVKAVTFSGGGEPLCYPYIVEAINGFLRGGIKIGILTNGRLLEGKAAEILAKGATWVRISMDAADSQTYAEIRGVSSGEFDKVCANICNFAKMRRKTCELGIHYVVTEENHLDVFKFLKLMKNLGVGHVKLSESVVSAKREENRKYHKPFFDLVKKQISEGLTTLSDDNFKIIDKFSGLFDEKTNDCYGKQYYWCPFIQVLTVIGADMNVYTCQDKAYSNKGMLGSIKGKSFQRLWFSNKTKERLLNLNPSRECYHHCTQHAKNLMLLDYFDVDRSHLEFV